MRNLFRIIPWLSCKIFFGNVSCVFLLYSSFLSWNIEFLGIFHVSACCCVGHLGHLKGFGMLVLCARV